MTVEELRRSKDALIAAIRESGGTVHPNGDCLCPFHDDRSPSASIKLLDRGTWHFHCFPCNWGGDVFDVVQRATGCNFPQAREKAQAYVGCVAAPVAQKPKPLRVFSSPEVAAESYARFKNGGVEKLYRWSDDWVRARIKLPEDKTFLELTRTAGGWVQKAPARPHCLYRISGIDLSKTVYICEGEKACDAGWTHGYQCTTSGSSSSAESADWSALAGANVVILADNDLPGLRYAVAVASILARLNPKPTSIKARVPGRPFSHDLFDELKQTRGIK
jgi:hypothetical protein